MDTLEEEHAAMSTKLTEADQKLSGDNRAGDECKNCGQELRHFVGCITCVMFAERDTTDWQEALRNLYVAGCRMTFTNCDHVIAGPSCDWECGSRDKWKTALERAKKLLGTI